MITDRAAENEPIAFLAIPQCCFPLLYVAIQVLQNRGLLYYEIDDMENALQDFLAAAKVHKYMLTKFMLPRNKRFFKLWLVQFFPGETYTLGCFYVYIFLLQIVFMYSSI